MSKLFLAVAVVLTGLTEAFASGGVICELEATVKQVHALGILGETVSMSRMDGTDTFRYVAVLDITSAVRVFGMEECITGEQLIELKGKTQVKVGDTLKIGYHFVYDRPGYSKTFNLK